MTLPDSQLSEAVMTAMKSSVDEPPAFTSSYADVVRDGRGARRRRRLALALAALPTVAVLAGAGIGVGVLVSGPAAHRGAGHHPTALVSLGSVPKDAVRVASTAAVLAKAVEQNSPSSDTFNLYDSDGNGVAGETDLDGWADDGNGRSRIYVTDDTTAGMLTPNPCNDSEFVDGGVCTATPLSDGDLLVTRDETGTTYTQTLAVLIHPDGSGLSAESDNGWFPNQPTGATPLTPGSKRDLGLMTVTRKDPLYTAEQLATILQAANAELS